MIRINDITEENEKVLNMLKRENNAIENNIIKDLEIISTFRNIIDPELKINVFDLGLIYDFELKNKTLNIEMTLTTPACPLSDFFINTIKKEFLKFDYITNVNIKFVWEPIWNPKNLPLEIRSFINY